MARTRLLFLIRNSDGEVVMGDTLVMVGTRKGLWIGRSDEARRDWSWTGPHFAMEEVYSCLVDTRGDRPRLLAGASSSWLGPQVWRSDDLGETWQETPNGAVRFPEDTGEAVARVWQLTPGAEDGVVYAGTEPGAIFKSDRPRRDLRARARALGQPPAPGVERRLRRARRSTRSCRTPRSPRAVLAAISTGGVYRTDDGGDSWYPSNTGVKAEFMPGERTYPEFGQCVHKVTRHPARPDRLYLQNHGGVYRSDDGGDTWQDIAPGLPAEFGFPIVVHPHDPETRLRLPDHRRRRALAGRRATPASGARPTAARTGSRSATARCPTTTTSR